MADSLVVGPFLADGVRDCQRTVSSPTAIKEPSAAWRTCGEESGLYEPIERRKVYELIAERLLAQIGERRWKPGDPLPTERALMDTYQVGRSSVREALRILESKGLIKSAHNGGFAVADYGSMLNRSLQLLLQMQETNLHELFEMRKILEVEVAALAASRRTEEDLAHMARAIDEMIEGLASEDRYIGADLQFHLTVAEASGNRIAVHMMHAIRELLHRALRSIYPIPGSPQRSIAQHRTILAAIAAKRPSDARERMREHLVRVQGDISDLLVGGATPQHDAAILQEAEARGGSR